MITTLRPIILETLTVMRYILMMHKTYSRTKLDEVQDLVRDRDHDRLSLGVVKAIHCLDITEHVEASGEDDEQQQCGEQTDPDGHREEPYTVPGWTEGAVASSRIMEGFHLNTCH